MWIHVPNSYLASAPEPGDSTEASTWRSEMLARSATLNAKEAPSSSWLRAWKRGGWWTRLFGRISSPSMAGHGVDAFRASLLEYPANLIPWPVRDSEPTTLATSGLSLQGSFEIFSPSGSSSKTSPESLSTTLSASGPNYRRWVTALRKSSSRRRKSAPHTNANASSYWPNARVPTGGGESAARKQELGRTESGGGDLQAAATDWRTPDAPGTGGARNRQAGTNQTVPENGLLGRQAPGFFPLSLPDTAEEGPATATTNHAGNMDALPVTTGEPSSASGQTSHRRSLNPKFAAWLMGWEPEWTSLAPLNSGLPETVLCLCRQPTPSGSSNWPTPDTQNARGGQMRTEAHGRHAVSLHHVIEGWTE